jgi:hypothetical protein
MTTSQMHIAFKLELDKIDSLQYPSFTTNEIDYWLNQGIRKFVKTRYSGVNYKRDGFEQTQKRIDDLRTLVHEESIDCTSTGASKPNGRILVSTLSSFADPYWFSLGEEVLLELPNRTEIRQGVTEVTADEYRFEIDNPYSTFRLQYGTAKPLRLFYGDNIEFISDGLYTVDKAYVRYIKAPAVVVYNTTNCNLPEHTHDEIVSLSVQMALENIEQPRQQTYAQNIATME